jgi:hypothetical protein
VASGLLSGEAEEGGGALVPVVGSAQCARRRCPATPALVGEERGKAIRSVSIRLRWGKEGFGRVYGGIGFGGNGLRATYKQTPVTRRRVG